jgi:hypothetical protein
MKFRRSAHYFRNLAASIRQPGFQALFDAGQHRQTVNGIDGIGCSYYVDNDAIPAAVPLRRFDFLVRDDKWLRIDLSV